MKPERFEVVALSTEPGLATVLGGGGKMLPLNHFRKSGHRLILIRSAALINELPAVY